MSSLQSQWSLECISKKQDSERFCDVLSYVNNSKYVCEGQAELGSDILALSEQNCFFSISMIRNDINSRYFRTNKSTLYPSRTDAKGLVTLSLR